MANSHKALSPLALVESLDRPVGYACVFAQTHAAQAFELFIHAQPPYLG